MGSSPTPGFGRRAILPAPRARDRDLASSLDGPDQEPGRYGPTGVRESQDAPSDEPTKSFNPDAAWIDRWPVETYA